MIVTALDTTWYLHVITWPKFAAVLVGTWSAQSVGTVGFQWQKIRKSKNKKTPNANTQPTVTDVNFPSCWQDGRFICTKSWKWKWDDVMNSRSETSGNSWNNRHSTRFKWCPLRSPHFLYMIPAPKKLYLVSERI